MKTTSTVAIIIGLIGFVCVGGGSGWIAAMGVFFMMWGLNIDNATRK